jgi:predicted metal-binding membrane protein
MMTLQRERTFILALLLILASASWGMLIWQAGTMHGMDTGLTMGMGVALFMIIWVIMMIAMMLPSAAPMILTYARVQRDHELGGRVLMPTVVFLGAYLFIWTLFGALVYVGALAASGLAQQIPWLMMNAARIGGGILVLAGLYQLTPIKRACLAKCRTPLEFMRTSWRDGSSGAIRMGLAHGLACLGCSWLLFVLLFPVGLMNLAAMALLTALILAEKCLPSGERIARVATLALLLYGMLVIVLPAALPLSGPGM